MEGRAVSAARGAARERQVLELLRAEWWLAMRAPASRGFCDIIALRAMPPVYHGSDVRLIEVKSTQRNPWNDFGPAARQALSAAARQAGASAWVAWWPLHGKLQWIPESEWP